MRAITVRTLALACAGTLSGCWFDVTTVQTDAASKPPDAGSIADTNPADTNPADTNPGDTNPADTSPADAPPALDVAADFQVFADSAADSAGDSSADAAPPPAWFACSQPSDCAAVDIACCDHCNGGKLMAANKSYAGDVKVAFGAKDCDGVACTEMACLPPKLACQQGQCAIGAPATACGTLNEAACKANSACLPYYGHPPAQACFGTGPTLSSQVFLGCIKFAPCAGVLGCATSPSGEKFYVPHVCEAPPGWSVDTGSCCNAGCKVTQEARFCVRGKSGSQGEAVGVGDPIQVTVYPAGCWSSSCTKAQQAICNVQWSGGEPWDNVNIGGSFCLLDTSAGGPCTADCGGGGFATCSAGTWAAGSHTVNMGSLKLTVDVPSVLPFGGACVGSQF